MPTERILETLFGTSLVGLIRDREFLCGSEFPRTVLRNFPHQREKEDRKLEDIEWSKRHIRCSQVNRKIKSATLEGRPRATLKGEVLYIPICRS